MKTALGIRFYDSDPARLASLEAFIRRFLSSFQLQMICVAVNCDEDHTGAADYLENLSLPRTKIIRINGGGRFTPALNAIAHTAAMEDCTHVLFCSPEINLTETAVIELQTRADDLTLVAGARLPGHDFYQGTHWGRGDSIPWNTLALWNLKFLLRTGFSLIGDFALDPHQAGVEEFATCAILQKLYPGLKVNLLDIPGISWDIDDLSPERKKRHTEKLATKNIRVDTQVRFMGFDASAVTVNHIQLISAQPSLSEIAGPTDVVDEWGFVIGRA
jgi:hypothetical protein